MYEKLNILGIETSCDETAVSLFNNKHGIISEYIFTQTIHNSYGGTVPELASQDHLKKIFNIFFFVIKKERFLLNSLNNIGYTNGPGLKGSLLVGSSFAKSLGFTLNIPTIGVNHLEAHFSINLAFSKKLKYPLITLLVSGAHTIILKLKNYNNFELIGESLDDGVGETFDKIARLFRLNPISGIAIEKFPKYKKNYRNLKILNKSKNLYSYNFSFSGLKSSLIRLEKFFDKTNLIYNFECVIISMFFNKCRNFIKENKDVYSIIIAGGVSSNKELRISIKNLCEEFNLFFLCLPKKYCTDNASMVSILSLIKFYDGFYDNDLSIDSYPDLRIV